MAEKIAEWKEKQEAIARGEVTQDDVEMEDEPLYKPDTEVGLCSLSHDTCISILYKGLGLFNFTSTAVKSKLKNKKQFQNLIEKSYKQRQNKYP